MILAQSSISLVTFSHPIFRAHIKSYSSTSLRPLMDAHSHIHAYPMKPTIYLSHRVGFITNLKPTCGVLPSAFLTGLLSENSWFLAPKNKRKKRPLVDMRAQARGCQWLCNRQQWAFWEQPKGHETNASTCSFHFFVIQSVIHAAWKRTDWVPRFGWNTVKPNGERSSQPHHSLCYNWTTQLICKQFICSSQLGWTIW